VRASVVGFGLVALAVGSAAPAAAQGLFTDARRIGMGGLSLERSGNLRRYNPAYRAVPPRSGPQGQAKLTIPLPLGLIQFFHDHPISQLGDDPTFNPDSAGFNPVEAINLLLNVPLFYEVKKAPTPTNDVVFAIGKDSLRVNLGQAGRLVPEDEFGLGFSSRPLEPGFGRRGFHVGVMGWLHTEAGFEVGDTLLAFLRDSVPAQHQTRYSVLTDGIVQAGLAPSLSYAGRVWGDTAQGIYLGAALHYYLGAAYIKVTGDGGFITGDTIFGGANPVTTDGRAFTQYSKVGNALGRGVGGDLGIAFISGPMELGIGVSDIGATITWPDTRRDSAFYSDSAYSQALLPNHVETKTELPVSYVANLAYTIGTTTLGADLVNNGRGTTLHLGGEKRLGLVAVRGGVSRDQRKRIEFGWGGGVWLGSISFDVGFWTHTNSLSNERAITMATSLSIY
jgi:hypothetical protein